MNRPFHIYPLGETALTIEVGDEISEAVQAKVLSLQHFLQQLYIPGFIEMVPAYCSVTVYYDLNEIVKKAPVNACLFQWLQHYLEEQLSNWDTEHTFSSTTVIKEIPVCYDEPFGLDIKEVADYHHLPVEKIIELHTSTVYKVYMMGFSPGFPYMGILPASLITPRKSSPRVRVPAGSVAISGNQTGVYPIESPGGWNIIGRTPLKLFDKAKDNPFLLNTGDSIKFIPITQQQFEQWEK